jgi:hypothetical protein
MTEAEAKKAALVRWAMRQLAGRDDEPMPDIEGLTRADLNAAHVEVGRRIGVGLATAQARIKARLSDLPLDQLEALDLGLQTEFAALLAKYFSQPPFGGK